MTVEFPITELATRGVKYLWKLICRPRIHEQHAPVNLFEYVQPYGSLEHVEKVLGVPYRKEGRWITIKFADVFVQLTSQNNSTIASVDVLLRRPRFRTTFPIYPLDFVLGKLKLSQVLDSKAELTKEFSSKFFCFYVTKYFGNPGKYFYYTFGIYSGPGIVRPKFEWNRERDELATDPHKLLVNWIRISTSAKDRTTPNFHQFV